MLPATHLLVRRLFIPSTIAMLLLSAPLRADEPAPDRNQARFEIKFMQDMVDHHSMAVMMANLCEERAIHDDLLMLCDEIVEAQTAEIEEMQGWLNDWHGIFYEPQMSRKMERQLGSLAGLDGEEFEIAFMEMMIEHHRMAIKEGQQCLKKAYHTELKELCEDIIATQSMEIMLMESWLCDWYERCD